MFADQDPLASRLLAGWARPPLPPIALIERPRLLGRLDGVLERPVTVLAAPAGYGKTVLAAHWQRQRCAAPAAWLDLGSEDAEPERFPDQLCHVHRRRQPGRAVPVEWFIVAEPGRWPELLYL